MSFLFLDDFLGGIFNTNYNLTWKLRKHPKFWLAEVIRRSQVTKLFDMTRIWAHEHFRPKKV